MLRMLCFLTVGPRIVLPQGASSGTADACCVYVLTTLRQQRPKSRATPESGVAKRGCAAGAALNIVHVNHLVLLDLMFGSHFMIRMK